MNKCPICGKPSNSYMGNVRKDKLCREHATQLKNNKIEQCETCKEWKNTDEQCKNCSKKVLIDKTNTCIICGKESNGYHFCPKCYSDFKDKEIVLQINKCQTVEILNKDYFNKKFTADDGHVVKSRDELIIDNWFYSNKILHGYEKKFFSKDSEELKPDWTLSNYGDIGEIIVEYWGIEKSAEYNKSKEYKLGIYRKENVTLISLYPKDIENISEVLNKKLKTIKKGEVQG